MEPQSKPGLANSPMDKVIDSYQATSIKLRDLEAELANAKSRAWGDGKTDMEKKINMEAYVAKQQAEVDKLQDMLTLTQLVLGK
jgi:hypothetical protein